MRRFESFVAIDWSGAKGKKHKGGDDEGGGGKKKKKVK